MELAFRKAPSLLQFCTKIMAKTTERNRAKKYFFKGYSQKEIAQKVGVQPKTITEWVKKYGWREERDARINGTDNQVSNIKALISKITERRLRMNREMEEALETENFQRHAELQQEANRLAAEVANYNKTLMNLDKENKISLATYLEVMDDVFNAIQVHDVDIYMSLLDFQEQHITQMSLKLG